MGERGDVGQKKFGTVPFLFDAWTGKCDSTNSIYFSPSYSPNIRKFSKFSSGVSVGLRMPRTVEGLEPGTLVCRFSDTKPSCR
jgi:hypothetical protein